MWFKRAVATLTIAIAVGAAAGPSFAVNSPTPVGSLTFATPGHAGPVYTTGTNNTYSTTVQLNKNPGTSTQMGQVTVRFEKWQNSPHTLVSWYSFTFASRGRLAAGMKGTIFNFDGTGLGCSSATGSYSITNAANSGSTITALSITFTEMCGSTPLTGSLSYSIK